MKHTRPAAVKVINPDEEELMRPGQGIKQPPTPKARRLSISVSDTSLPPPILSSATMRTPSSSSSSLSLPSFASTSSAAVEPKSSQLPQAFLVREPLPESVGIEAAVTSALASEGNDGNAMACRLIVSALDSLMVGAVTASAPQKQSSASSTAVENLPLYEGLVSLSRKKGPLFSSPALLEPLVWMLSGKNVRSRVPGMAAKRSASLCLLVCSLLERGYRDAPRWPVQFVQALIDDALGERAWCEDEHTKWFVDEIVRGIAGDAPTESLSQQLSSNHSASSTSTTPTVAQQAEPMEVEEELQSGSVNGANSGGGSLAKSRFAESRKEVEAIVLQPLQDFFGTKIASAPKCSVNVFLASLRFPKFRVFATTLLDEWLGSNSSLTRHVKDVLNKIAAMTTEDTLESRETLTQLLRSKAKSFLSQLVFDGVDKIIHSNPAFPAFALRSFFETEILVDSTQQYNQKMFTAIWNSLPAPEKLLAEIFKDYFSKLGNPTQLFSAARKIIRSSSEVSVPLLCKSFLSVETLLNDLAAAPSSDAYVRFVCDIVWLCLVMASPPCGADTAAYAANVADIQGDAMAWCLHVLPLVFPKSTLTEAAMNSPAIAIVRQFLLLEPSAFISPELFSDQERKQISVYVGDQSQFLFPVHEATITSVLSLAVECLQLPSEMALNTLVALVNRAALFSVAFPAKPSLQVSDTRLVEHVLHLAVVHDNAGNMVAGFCYTEALWRACILLVVLGSFDPCGFGAFVWSTVPTVRALMEMVVTRQWRYPALVPDGDTQSDFDARLDFFDATDALASPYGGAVRPFSSGQQPRRPPQGTIDSLRAIDQRYHISSRLIACRTPEYLTEVVRVQNPSKMASWLTPVVQSDPSLVEVLPSAVLCELVLGVATTSSGLEDHMDRIVGGLRRQIVESTPPHTSATAVIEFFLVRLSSERLIVRNQAKDVLSRLVGCSDPSTSDPSWLDILRSLEWLQSPSGSGAAMVMVCKKIAAALQCETCPRVLCKYLTFLWENRTTLLPRDAASHLCSLLRRPIVRRALFDDYEGAPEARDIAVKMLDEAFSDPGDSATAAQLQAEVSLAFLELLAFVPEGDLPWCRLFVAMFPPSRRPMAAEGVAITADNARVFVHSKNPALIAASVAVLCPADQLRAACTLGVSRETASCAIAGLLSAESSSPGTIKEIARAADIASIAPFMEIHVQGNVEHAEDLLRLLRCP